MPYANLSAFKIVRRLDSITVAGWNVLLPRGDGAEGVGVT
jgi:hypothetical protein